MGAKEAESYMDIKKAAGWLLFVNAGHKRAPANLLEISITFSCTLFSDLCSLAFEPFHYQLILGPNFRYSLSYFSL